MIIDENNKIEEERKTDFLARIQQTDIIYNSVNFDDPISTLSYFTKLCQPFTRNSEEELN